MEEKIPLGLNRNGAGSENLAGLARRMRMPHAREVGVEGVWHRVLCSWVANHKFGWVLVAVVDPIGGGFSVPMAMGDLASLVRGSRWDWNVGSQLQPG